ncbi:MAG: YbdD/YjiX family protein [Propionibacteriaceae bacterium]|jgi:uncharacterized short protein YbdD (DUF466 family)|nr:YbdD/YjiX family protein [Propionibacteriaceae bacterium]
MTVAASSHRPSRTLVDGVSRVARAVRWYVRELLGAAAYDHYLERFALDHGDDDSHQPMTEKQYWRQRIDEQPLDARCC